jgi:hypothetical protein
MATLTSRTRFWLRSCVVHFAERQNPVARISSDVMMNTNEPLKQGL